MPKPSRPYELFSPKHNPTIQAKLGAALLHPLPGMLPVDISRVLEDAELMFKKEMQANVNSEELRSLQFPLPPIDLQAAIIRQIHANRDKIRIERDASAQMAREAQIALRRLILPPSTP